MRNMSDLFSKHKEYKILHVHVPSLAWFVMTIAKFHKIQNRIIHSHGTMYGEGFLKTIRNFVFFKITLLGANRYWACSKAAAKFAFGAKKVIRGEVNIVNNSIDMKKFRYSHKIRDDIRNSLGLSGEIVVGHVGGFVPVKNQKFLIDVFNELNKSHEKCVLILIGDGPMAESVVEYAKIKKVSESVFFLGARSDVNDLMQAMDILVLPSFKEGFPVVSVEAQAAGLNCLLSDTITEEVRLTNLVHYLSLSQGPEEWSNKIVEIVKGNKRDEITYGSKLELFDNEKASTKLEQYYLDLL